MSRVITLGLSIIFAMASLGLAWFAGYKYVWVLTLLVLSVSFICLLAFRHNNKRFGVIGYVIIFFLSMVFAVMIYKLKFEAKEFFNIAQMNTEESLKLIKKFKLKAKADDATLKKIISNIKKK